MRTLKGIMINGEWLGDRVIINDLFRSICEISPSIMQEFVKLINSIDKLDEVVSIENFSFSNKNAINIGFKNQNTQGLATLLFKKENGILFFEDKSVEFFDGNDNCKAAAEKKDAKKVDEVSIFRKEEDISENNTNEIIEDVSENVSNAEIDELAEEHNEEKEAEMEEFEKLDEVSNMTDDDVDENTEFTIQNDCSGIISDLTNRLVNVPLHPIKVVIANSANSCEKQQEENLVEVDDVDKVEELTSEENSIEEANETQENTLENVQEDMQGNSIDVPNSIENIEELVLEDSKITAQETTRITDKISEEATTISGEIIEDDIKLSINDVQQINEMPETNCEEIEDCLSDFYNVTKTIEETDEVANDNVAMQAVLNEMLYLREELNKMKEESQKYSFAPQPNNKNNIEDEDADFRIMGDGERINASIVDEDLFIAGDKLYRWGDTLYLEG